MEPLDGELAVAFHWVVMIVVVLACIVGFGSLGAAVVCTAIGIMAPKVLVIVAPLIAVPTIFTIFWFFAKREGMTLGEWIEENNTGGGRGGSSGCGGCGGD